MPYHALVPLSAALANLAICLLVLRKGLREPLNRAFALTAAGIVTWNLDIFCLYYFDDAYLAVRALLDDGHDFDGVFAMTDANAMGAIRALNEGSRRIPADVQVIGFDNLRLCRFQTPSLSSIEPGNDEMADAIVDLMVRRLSGAGPREPRRVTATAKRWCWRRSATRRLRSARSASNIGAGATPSSTKPPTRNAWFRTSATCCARWRTSTA